MKRIFLIFCLVVSALAGWSQRVHMIGDSHVAGKLYPERVGEILKREYPDLTFSFFGKNGARFDTYNNTPGYMKAIIDKKPEVLIAALGGNDSYTDHYRQSFILEQITKFYDTIHEALPDCLIIFVTPFYNWYKTRGGKRIINESTGMIADDIVDFAETHPNCFVVDNNADVDLDFAYNDNIIRNDGVHLTREGYEIYARMIAQSIIIQRILDEFYED